MANEELLLVACGVETVDDADLPLDCTGGMTVDAERMEEAAATVGSSSSPNSSTPRL